MYNAFIYIYIYIYIYDSQIVHHNPCFNLFILYNNSFDNQGSEINKNDIIYTIVHIYIYLYIYIYIYIFIFICIYIYIYIFMNTAFVIRAKSQNDVVKAKF